MAVLNPLAVSRSFPDVTARPLLLQPVRPVTGPVAAPDARAHVRPAAWVLGLVAVFILTLATSAAIGTRPSAPTTAVTPTGPAESLAYPAWTVQPGDTLWSIARSTAPQADPRAVVLQLQVLNGVGPGHVLQPGEVLQVPHAAR